MSSSSSKQTPPKTKANANGPIQRLARSRIKQPAMPIPPLESKKTSNPNVKPPRANHHQKPSNKGDPATSQPVPCPRTPLICVLTSPGSQPNPTLPFNALPYHSYFPRPRPEADRAREPGAPAPPPACPCLTELLRANEDAVACCERGTWRSAFFSAGGLGAAKGVVAVVVVVVAGAWFLDAGLDAGAAALERVLGVRSSVCVCVCGAFA
ncbi:uncharacterized protein BKA78DRAFT_328659 [Phyllosticta capitalensis]|uniref:uncharacterized protein n=1 Tax=Phyllosticta capitalensis TaxID=121624 RepID=UPI00312FB406